MEIGAKIYFDKITGNVILNAGERSGGVIPTTEEQDFATYLVLKERDPETVGMIQLEYGAYAADYAKGGVITRVDLDTSEPLFTYLDLTEPETPQEPRPALSKEVEILKKADLDNKKAIALLLTMVQTSDA